MLIYKKIVKRVKRVKRVNVLYRPIKEEKIYLYRDFTHITLFTQITQITQKRKMRVEMRKKDTEQVICMGCGDFFKRSQSIDVSPWGYCIVCKSPTVRELLKKMKEA